MANTITLDNENGIIKVGDGTATNPSITFDDDINTGMYSSADNELAFTTAGTNAVTIDSSQRVTFSDTIDAASSGSRIGNHYITTTTIELNHQGTGNRNSLIDFHNQGTSGGSPALDDYNARIIKWAPDGGTPGVFLLQNIDGGDLLISQQAPGENLILETTALGGNLNLVTRGANDINLSTNDTQRVHISDSGVIGVDGNVVFDTGNGGQAVYFTRNNFTIIPTKEYMSITLTDNTVTHHYNNDESTSIIQWRLESTDTEDGSPNDASDRTLELISGTSGFFFRSPDIQFQSGDGLAVTPTYTFDNDDNTGMYSIGSDLLGFSAGGTLRLQLSTGTSVFYSDLTVEDDSPQVILKSTGSPTTNVNVWFRNSANISRGVLWWDEAGETMGMRTYDSGGVTANEIRVAQEYVDIIQPLYIVAGDATVPAIAFRSDTDTGIYSATPNSISFLTGGSANVSIGALGTVSINAALALDLTSNTASIYMDTDHDRRITCNDGGGNWNFRSANYFDTTEKYTKTGDGASKIEFGSDGTNGFITLQAAATGTADATITWDNTLTLTTSAMSVTLPIRTAAGSVTEPAFSFTGDTNTGMYGDGSGGIYFTADGQQQIDITSSRTRVFDKLLVDNNTDLGGTIGNTVQLFEINGENTNSAVLMFELHRFATGTSWNESELRIRKRIDATDMSFISFRGATGTTNSRFVIGHDVSGDIAEFVGTGETFFSGPVYLPVGSPSVPAIAFETDQNTGMYLSDVNEMSFVTNGEKRLTLTTTGPIIDINNTMTIQAPAWSNLHLVANTSGTDPVFRLENSAGNYWDIRLDDSASDEFQWRYDGTIYHTISSSGRHRGVDGTAALATYSFKNDSNSGMYSSAADEIGFATAGILRLSIGSSGHLNAIDGSAGAPTYSFTNDTNTGMYSSAADELAFSTNSTQRMKVDNSRVTIIDILNLPQYTTAGAPSGSTGDVIYVSDGDAGNPCLGIYDGSSFKRVALGATISAT